MSWIKKIFAAKYIMSFARQMMTVVGTWLATVPGLSSDDITNFTDSGSKVVYGVLLVLASQGWSLFDKKANQ